MTMPEHNIRLLSRGRDRHHRRRARADVARELRLIRTLLAGLLLIVVVYGMRAAAPVLVPVALAFLMYLLLASPVDRYSGRYFPRPLISAVVLALLCLPPVAGGLYLAEPALNWIREAPVSIADVRQRVEKLAEPLEPVKNASVAMEDAVQELTAGDERPQTVKVQAPGVIEQLLSGLPMVASSFVLAVAIAFLLLISGNRLISVALARSSRFADRRRAREAIEAMKTDVSRYLGTILLINIGLGFVCAAAFAALGLPNPLLWGVFAGCMNFAPYVGALVTAAVVTLASLMVNTEPQAIFAPTAVFLTLTFIEGQFVTPLVLGSRLAVNPAVVVVLVVGFAALWGVAGALMALPLCVVARTAWRHFTRLPAAERAASGTGIA